MHEGTIGLVIRHQTPSSRPTLKSVAPAGNLNYIFTRKTGQTGEKCFGELHMRHKPFKTAKTLQAI